MSMRMDNVLISEAVDFDRVNKGQLTRRSSPVDTGGAPPTAAVCRAGVLRVWGTADGIYRCADGDAAAARVTGCRP
jgi:hypothetical protein